jgi:hypothetical protein
VAPSECRASDFGGTTGRPRAAFAQKRAGVLANSYTDFELIVVDQNADSATREAMAAIADERLRYAAIEAGNGTGLVSILSPGMLFALAVRCVPDGHGYSRNLLLLATDRRPDVGGIA